MQKHLCRPGKKVEVLSAFDPAFSAQRKEVPKAYVPLRGHKRKKCFYQYRSRFGLRATFFWPEPQKKAKGLPGFPRTPGYWTVFF